MAKGPTLNDITGGFASNDLLNDNFDSIETAFNNTLSLDGSTPNSMGADLDLNGYAILNQKATNGNENFIWKGDWATGTAYAVNNLVYVTLSESATNGGSTYIVTTAHTAGATFDGDISNFDLFALQGEDGAPGAGTGDVIGPTGATDNAVALFDGTTGKLIKDSTVLLTTKADKVVPTVVGDFAALDASGNLTDSGISPDDYQTTNANLTDVAAITQTKGDLIVSNGSDFIDVGVGTNDQVLTADSAQASGVKWADAAGGGVWELMETWTPTAVATKDFTWNEATYSDIRLVLEGVVCSTDGGLFTLQFGHTNATVFYNGTNDYDTIHITPSIFATNSTVEGEDRTGQTSIHLSDYNGTNNDEGFSGSFLISGCGSAKSWPAVSGMSMGSSPEGTAQFRFVLGTLVDSTGDSTVIDAIRIGASATFEAGIGTVYLYGLKRA